MTWQQLEKLTIDGRFLKVEYSYGSYSPKRFQSNKAYSTKKNPNKKQPGKLHTIQLNAIKFESKYSHLEKAFHLYYSQEELSAY